MKFTLWEWNKIWEMLKRDQSKLQRKAQEWKDKRREANNNTPELAEAEMWEKKYLEELAHVNRMLAKLENEEL